MTKQCEWRLVSKDGYEDRYRTQCGQTMVFAVPEEVGICFAPTPAEAGVKYCQHCGGLVSVRNPKR